MAAILGKAFVVPIKACDESCCNPCLNSCKSCCSAGCHMLSKPFISIVILCLVFNLPLLLFNIIVLAIDQDKNICPDKLYSWIYIIMVVYVANIIMAYYSFWFLNRPYECPPEHQSRELNKRVSKLLCYDIRMAAYIVVSIFTFVWLCVGYIWSADTQPNCRVSGIYGAVLGSQSSLWTYYSLLFIFFVLAYLYQRVALTKDTPEVAQAFVFPFTQMLASFVTANQASAGQSQPHSKTQSQRVPVVAVDDINLRPAKPVAPAASASPSASSSAHSANTQSTSSSADVTGALVNLGAALSRTIQKKMDEKSEKSTKR